MNNIKGIIKQSGIKQYEVANYLKMQESNFSRKLRYPVTAEFEANVLRAIASIQLERSLTNESFEK